MAGTGAPRTADEDRLESAVSVPDSSACWQASQDAIVRPPSSPLRRYRLGTMFSADAVPLAALQADPSREVKRATDEHRPVLVTSRGRGVAVLESLIDYETAEEERAFMRAVVAGLADLETGREVDLATAKAQLGIE